MIRGGRASTKQIAEKVRARERARERSERIGNWSSVDLLGRGVLRSFHDNPRCALKGNMPTRHEEEEEEKEDEEENDHEKYDSDKKKARPQGKRGETTKTANTSHPTRTRRRESQISPDATNHAREST